MAWEPDLDNPIQVEPEDVFLNRAQEFKTWLNQLEEKPIAIVGHGTFFAQLAGHHMKNCEIHKYR